ncbi:hypothetical protein ABT299_27285 [Spirillospora sp. NPDC000708]
MNVVDRPSGLVDGFAASCAQMTGAKDGATEVVECLAEGAALVADEASVRMLVREEAFELKEKVVDLDGGGVNGIQHRVDGRRSGEAAWLVYSSIQ